MGYFGILKRDLVKQVIAGVNRLKLGDMRFRVKQIPKGFYDYSLNNEWLNLSFVTHSVSAETPSIKAQFKSASLWKNGVEASYQRAVEVVKDAFDEGITDERVMHADLCADFPWPQNFEPNDVKRFVTRAEDRLTYSRRGQFSGFQFPSKSIKALVYNKTLEIKSSNKHWLYTCWGVEPGTMVWRVEYQCEGRWLRGRGIYTYNDLATGCQVLWDYLSKEWLSMREPRGKNKSHWPIEPRWRSVEAAKIELDAVANSIDFTIHQDWSMTGKRAIDQIAGVVKRYAADSEIESYSEALSSILPEIRLKLYLAEREPVQPTSNCPSCSVSKKHGREST